IYTVTAEDGTTTKDWTVTVSVYVGIEDVENSALAIYPNPNNGNFTLDFTNINGKVNYQIYDTKGSIIISDDFVANGSAIKEVSLNLVPGVYFVRLVTETQSLVEKLVVE
ncbi:MAG: T9SS type A sorting domain-containing protein, partial [Bacteroidales bacterium]